MIRRAVEAWAAAEPGYAEQTESRAEVAGERARLGAELADARRRFSKLATRYSAGDIDHDEWAGIEERWDAARERLDAEIAGLTRTLAEPVLPADVRWDRRSGDECRKLAGRALELPVRVAPGNGGGAARRPADRIELRARVRRP